VAEFESSFIKALADERAAGMLKQGISNMLVHQSADAQQLRILSIKRFVSAKRRLKSPH